jgi:hypothetical protein
MATPHRRSASISFRRSGGCRLSSEPHGLADGARPVGRGPHAGQRQSKPRRRACGPPARAS